MKRLHVHVSVENLQDSIRFYSAVFGVQPTVEKTDYAKWMLDEPRINFAISMRGQRAGVNHLGIQVESAEELQQMRSQLEAADLGLSEQTAVSCCYARSDKYWVTDPAGVAWETFHSLNSIPIYGDEPRAGAASPENQACCIPLAPARVTKDESARPEASKQSCCV